MKIPANETVTDLDIFHPYRDWNRMGINCRPPTPTNGVSSEITKFFACKMKIFFFLQLKKV
jgi:hypothetical protein